MRKRELGQGNGDAEGFQHVTARVKDLGQSSEWMRPIEIGYAPLGIN